MIRAYLAFLLLRGAARVAWRLIKVAAVAALIVAAAPVSVVAAGAVLAAWWCGWPPRRLYAAAAWCLPMVAVWLAAAAASGQRPYRAWLETWRLAAGGHAAVAAVTVAPAAIPLGLLAGGLAWAVRIYRMETGAGGLSPSSAISFDRRQWRRQVRSARARIAAPGAVPLTSRNGDVVVGGTIRAVRHPARPVMALPHGRLRSHQVVIGTTGTGNLPPGLPYGCERAATLPGASRAPSPTAAGCPRRPRPAAAVPAGTGAWVSG